MDRKPENDLAAVACEVLSMPGSTRMTVGRLERGLSEYYPAEDAEAWDRTGCSVGDRSAVVTGIAVALDATVATIDAARACGANVLVTHHPPYLSVPDSLVVDDAHRGSSAATVCHAVETQVALMNFHTALDVSPRAQVVLPRMLGLSCNGVFDALRDGEPIGYGQLCAPEAADAGMDVDHLAARCLSVFGRMPRVWGDGTRPADRIVTATGSAGSLIDRCLAQDVDVLVCGEVHYHDALAAVGSSLSIIELGHDVSEFPLCAVLAATIESLGVPDTAIRVIDEGTLWHTPEAIRK